jgi:hypothetical protein
MLGTSGTGKRTLGEYLALECGFAHVHVYGGPSLRGKVEALLGAGAGEHDIVVTCTGNCTPPEIDWLRGLEFDCVWFDSDRGAAQAAGTCFVDPFDRRGAYRVLGEVVADLLSPSLGRTAKTAGGALGAPATR